MSAPDLLVILVVGIIVLTSLAPRLRVPQPVLLTVFGLLLGLVPALPQIRVPPEVILPTVLPPLLFAATQRTSVHEFRRAARPVLLLAVGLTAATAAAVAAAAHALGLSWPLAWALGAMVSPPDPVAATAVARRLSLPRRVVAVLEGEGLFNDAAALVMYQIALAAAVSGHFSVAFGLGELAVSVLGGTTLGLALGWAGRLGLTRLREAPAEMTLTIAVPYVAYLLAERVGASGVLAVLSSGLYLGARGHVSLTPGGFLLGRQVWSYADFAVSSLAFGFLGLELATVLEQRQTDATSLELAGVVIATLLVVRVAWTFPASWLATWRTGRRNVTAPTTWRETAVVAWSGMRGVVTVATALALPLTDDAGAPLPRRSEIVLVALTAVLVTLLVQGLTLPSVVRALGVRETVNETDEVIRLRRQAAEAALERLRSLGLDEGPDAGAPGGPDAPGDRPQAVLIRQYEGLVRTPASIHALRQDEATRDRLGELRRQAIEAERAVVLDARARGEVTTQVADRVLADVELRAIRGHE